MHIAKQVLLGWQAGAAGQSFSVAELLLPLLGLVFLLIVAIVVARRWSRNDPDASISASAMLTDFRDLKDKGTLSADEYQRIKETLGGRFRAETGTRETAGKEAPNDAAAPDNAGGLDAGTQEMTKFTTPDMPVIPPPPPPPPLSAGEAGDSA